MKKYDISNKRRLSGLETQCATELLYKTSLQKKKGSRTFYDILIVNNDPNPPVQKWINIYWATLYRKTGIAITD